MKRGLLIGLVVLTAAGCATAPTGPAKPPSVDVTGAWEGEIVSQFGNSRVGLTLEQNGADVRGEIRFAGLQSLRPEGPLRGTVSGNVLSFNSSGNPTTTAELTVRGDEMSGPYRIVGTGTMIVRRRR